MPAVPHPGEQQPELFSMSCNYCSRMEKGCMCWGDNPQGKWIPDRLNLFNDNEDINIEQASWEVTWKESQTKHFYLLIFSPLCERLRAKQQPSNTGYAAAPPVSPSLWGQTPLAEPHAERTASWLFKLAGKGGWWFSVLVFFFPFHSVMLSHHPAQRSNPTSFQELSWPLFLITHLHTLQPLAIVVLQTVGK